MAEYTEAEYTEDEILVLLARNPWDLDVLLVLKRILNTKSLRLGVDGMVNREDFTDKSRAVLAGVHIHKPSRDVFQTALDRMWRKKQFPLTNNSPKEIIIGAGLHAAIYCAGRYARAKKLGIPWTPPLVLEAKERPGGTFAMTNNPAFFINSTNRPGDKTSVPYTSGSLNFIAHAPFQTYDVSGLIYPTNDIMGDVIRTMLAMYANVITETRVKEIAVNDRGFGQYFSVFIEKNGKAVSLFRVQRIINATGLGVSKKISDIKSEFYLTYEQFMQRMDTQFPLCNMKKVAVIGTGDSGKTVIESLMGLSPSVQMSVPSLDWVEEVDWYGFKEDRPITETTWCNENRGRYRSIGRFLRRDSSERKRIRAFPSKAANIRGGVGDSIWINNYPYDYVIDASGYEPSDSFFARSDLQSPIGRGRVPENASLNTFTVNNLETSKKLFTVPIPSRKSESSGYFTIGPAAGITASEYERSYLGIQENSASIFRYAPKTANLAAYLDGV